MELREIMTRNPEVVSRQTSLQEAAAKMKTLDVGLMPVCDGDRLTGLLTDRDITIRATADGRDPRRRDPPGSLGTGATETVSWTAVGIFTAGRARRNQRDLFGSATVA
jgi:CBS domain-containing protein